METTKINIELSEAFDNMVGNEFVDLLTFTFKPLSITGKVSEFDTNIWIEMSHGDVINYIYKGDECPYGEYECKIKINDTVIEANPENHFLFEIRGKYFEYLKKK